MGRGRSAGCHAGIARRAHPSTPSAGALGWPDTFAAEYVALTQLQGDAFITLDAALARAVKGLVRIAPIDALS